MLVCATCALLTSNPFRFVPSQMIPGVHDACWITSFLSFVFLYPSTFNLLEVRRDSCGSSAVVAKHLRQRCSGDMNLVCTRVMCTSVLTRKRYGRNDLNSRPVRSAIKE